MKDKPRSLDSVKRRSKEQEGTAERLKEQAEAHKKRVDVLDIAAQLQSQSSDAMESRQGKEVEEAIKREKEDSEKELGRLKQEQDELKKENEAMQKQVETKQSNNRKVRTRLDQGKHQFSESHMKQAQDIQESKLKEEWNDLQVAAAQLSVARLKLDKIKFD